MPVVHQLCEQRSGTWWVWNEREDTDSRSLHFADLYGNVIIAAQLTGPSA